MLHVLNSFFEQGGLPSKLLRVFLRYTSENLLYRGFKGNSGFLKTGLPHLLERLYPTLNLLSLFKERLKLLGIQGQRRLLLFLKHLAQFLEFNV